MTAGDARGVPRGETWQLSSESPWRRKKVFFVWTPQRVRIVVYFIAAYLALC
jgi:hypothetical protein